MNHIPFASRKKFLDNFHLQRSFRFVFRIFRVLLLFCTFLGVGLRVSDLHGMVHEMVHDLNHEFCDHGQQHHHDDDKPCTDPHHHHQCHCAQPVLGLTEFPFVKLGHHLVAGSALLEHGSWILPEGPTYEVDIPPVIA